MGNSEEAYFVGVDLGGTKTNVGIVNGRGDVIDQIRLETDASGGPDAVIEQVVGAYNLLRQETPFVIKSVGIGIAGQVNSKSGVVDFSPNLPGWNKIALKEKMEARLNLSVSIDNDLRVATWAEWKLGAGENCNDIVCVFVGTGIGGSVVSAGRLLSGSTNTFGEVGHMSIDFHGPQCSCGRRGCLEAFAGGWAIAKYAQWAISNYKTAGTMLLELSNHQIDQVSAKEVAQAFRRADPLAVMIIERVKEALIAGCANLINLYNPSRLILGGGFIEGVPELIPIIGEFILKEALPIAAASVSVIPTRLGKEAGMIGAALISGSGGVDS